jgi:tetratricopeptide (TPR) repeat protein
LNHLGLLGSWLYYPVSLLPLAIMFGLAIWKRKQLAIRSDFAAYKSKTATNIAIKRMKIAYSYLEKNKLASFYEETGKAIWNYLSDKLRIPVSELNKENVMFQLRQSGVSEQTSDAFQQLISDCEFARFAGGANLSDPMHIYNQTVRANGAETAFERAAAYYQKQDYGRALAIYDSLLKLGYESAELEFNAGNAYYRTGQIPQAILHYERAALLNPSDPETQHNLRIAYLSTVDKIEPEPLLFYEEWIRSIAYGGTVPFKTLLAQLLLWSSCGCFALYLFARKIKIRRWGFYLMVLTMTAGLVFWLLAENHRRHLHHNKGAIIFAEAIYVKGSPIKDGAKLFMLHEGTKVTVVDALEGWRKIRIANGNEGWVEADALEEI